MPPSIASSAQYEEASRARAAKMPRRGTAIANDPVITAEEANQIRTSIAIRGPARGTPIPMPSDRRR